MKKYKIAIVGAGSIGLRHLQNIVNVLQKSHVAYEIDLIRSGKGPDLNSDISAHICKTYLLKDVVPDDYDVVFITNPTYKHFETVKAFVPRTKHMFIEKPVFDTPDVSASELQLKNESVYYVGCPLRYTNVIDYIKTKLKDEKIYCVRAICSSYLPDWRPDQDYRKSYSAHAMQGGGVSSDLIHEWDYLLYLFGEPEKIFNIRGRFSDLEISSDDLSIYIAKYVDKAVEIHLDYFGRSPIREVHLFTAKDTIVGDIINSEIRYLRKQKTISFREQRNDCQLKEIEHFFDIIEGKCLNDNDVFTALKTLRISNSGNQS